MDVLSVEEAYRRLDDGTVVVERPDRGLLRLTGEQRVWFLQNTISNDVEGVDAGRWVASCFLSPKGKVMAHFRVGVLDEEVWLDVDPPGTADLVDWFTRYRFRTKVEIEDASRGALTLLGSAARDVCAPGSVRRDGDAVVFGDLLGPRPVADVHGPAPFLDGFPRADPELYEILRLEAGVGRFGVDYGPQTLGQEAGLTPILSVTKGCYVGQEVVARLHFRGHVNRVVRPLAFAGDPDPSSLPGRELHHGEAKAGTVTSAAASPARGVIGMGLVRVEVPEDAEVEVADAGTARVGPIPEGTKTA